MQKNFLFSTEDNLLMLLQSLSFLAMLVCAMHSQVNWNCRTNILHRAL